MSNPFPQFPPNPDIGDTFTDPNGGEWEYGTTGWFKTVITLSSTYPIKDLSEGTAVPAGDLGEIQFNDGGTPGQLAASPDLKWDDTAKELGIGGDINLDDGGSFTTTLQMVTATADRTISFPDATGTVGLVAGSSGQFAYNLAGAYAGTGGLTFTEGEGLRSSLPFGYGPSSGSNVTQATSKSTGVTLNNPCGRITTHNESLGPGSAVTFTLTNSLIGPGDVLVINHISGGTIGKYTFSPAAGTGSAAITIRNVTGNAEGEALVLKYVLIKACVGA